MLCGHYHRNSTLQMGVKGDAS